MFACTPRDATQRCCICRCAPERAVTSMWSTNPVQRPSMRMSGPVFDAPDVAELTRFYQCLLGWEIEKVEGPRPEYPPGDGWSRLRPADGSTKIEIQFEE